MSVKECQKYFSGKSGARPANAVSGKCLVIWLVKYFFLEPGCRPCSRGKNVDALKS